MKKYAPKDPFVSNSYGRGIDKVGIYEDKTKCGNAGGEAHTQPTETRSVAGWDKPFSKKLTF